MRTRFCHCFIIAAVVVLGGSLLPNKAWGAAARGPTSSTSKEQTGYRDRTLPLDTRVEDLLRQMTLEEKIQQVSGSDFEGHVNQRLQIPHFKMADGGLGVRNGGPATAFPAGVAMAATWDPQLMGRVGAALARETRGKGFNMLLAPMVNLQRLPTAGRNFETFSEDPFLVSGLTVPYIQGIQSAGVIACVKAIACNNQEWKRMTVDVRVSERALHELYFPAFRAAVQQADVQSVMTAYNKVNGLYSSENPYLITETLKKQWGFKGFTVSDWGAVHSTIPTALAGLDLEMPSDAYWGKKLLAAVQAGQVPESVIDDKVRRLLRARFWAGLFDSPEPADPALVGCDAHRQLAREVARESMVLLKNNGNLLPLEPGKLKRIAVIGPNAAELRVGGGGSSTVTPIARLSPLEAIRQIAGPGVKVRYALGCQEQEKLIYAPGERRSFFETIIDSAHLVPVGETPGPGGLTGEYFDNRALQGAPIFARTDSQIDFHWGKGSPDPRLQKGNYSVRWTGALVAPRSGRYRLKIASEDGMRLYLNGRLLYNNWGEHGYEPRAAEVALEAGKPSPIRVEYFNQSGEGTAELTWLYLDAPNPDLSDAVALAKSSDAVILCVGLCKDYEHEGLDRIGGLTMPPRQVALIEAVAAANPRTIVVLNSGGAVELNPWLAKVPALVEVWYPGQEGGTALAELLFGQANFSGKLPVSFIRNASQYPWAASCQSEQEVAEYSEGIYVGYRWLERHYTVPQFPFGFGLSYSRFDYGQMQVEPESLGKYKVSVAVTNRGPRTGDEIVQLYVRPLSPSVDRPVKELKGFARLHLEAGKTQTAVLRLEPKDFSFYDQSQHRWQFDAGKYELLVGASSSDIRARQSVEVKGYDRGAGN